MSSRLEILTDKQALITFDQNNCSSSHNGCQWCVTTSPTTPLRTGKFTGSGTGNMVPVYNSVDGVSDIMSMVRSDKAIFMPPLASDNCSYSIKLNKGLAILSTDVT